MASTLHIACLALVLSGLGCTSESGGGHARVGVSASALSMADVAGITVTVVGPDIDRGFDTDLQVTEPIRSDLLLVTP